MRLIPAESRNAEIWKSSDAHMIITILSIAALVIFLEIIDALFSVPDRSSILSFGERGGEDRFRAMLFRFPVVLFLLGGFLFLLGRPFPSVFLAALTGGLLFFGSRLKYDVLREPLMFCDAAVIGACIRHPRFYIGAIPPAARVVVLTVICLVGLSVAGLFVMDVLAIRAGTGVGTRLAGLFMIGISWLWLEALRYTGVARKLLPEANLDVGLCRYGLMATLALGWLRWKDDQACPLPSWPAVPEKVVGAGPIIVIIQCESFADPQEFGLTEQVSCALENLSKNREIGAVGTLEVSGFGAYTMRTEYGVLFGHEESALGFRRFDPYLSAWGQMKEALPARVSSLCGNRVFVHPHDLKFYGRERLMPAAGFNRIIGQDAFSETASSGRYIGDKAVGDCLVDLIHEASATPEGTLLFAVTIENHGPWEGGLSEYMRHLEEGDVLLGRMEQALEQCGREALLVFYGDHRPSLPSLAKPNHARYTPVVMRGFGGLRDVPSLNGNALTPAGLHHAITNVFRGEA